MKLTPEQLVGLASARPRGLPRRASILVQLGHGGKSRGRKRGRFSNAKQKRGSWRSRAWFEV